MVGPVARPDHEEMAAIQGHLHKIVIDGPRDLDIAYAMAQRGYDEAKWAEGQGVLAELIVSERLPDSFLTVARHWMEEAARTARAVLSDQPHLLAKLGLF